MTKGGRRSPDRKNAPSFIYEILYGRQRFLAGRSDGHAGKLWRGIRVDAHIPTAALDALAAIGRLELRSSCEGSGPDRPTFLILRFNGPENQATLQAFVAGMNSFDDIACGADRGAMGRMRVGITTAIWYRRDPAAFERWWHDLPLKIQVVLEVVDQLTAAQPVPPERRPPSRTPH